MSTTSIVIISLITYICIDRRLELVGFLVVVLTGVGHDSVEDCSLFLQLLLFIILLGGELDQVCLINLKPQQRY